MDDVLNNIFSRLPYDDLYNALLVNHHWHDNALPVILRRAAREMPIIGVHLTSSCATARQEDWDGGVRYDHKTKAYVPVDDILVWCDCDDVTLSIDAFDGLRMATGHTLHNCRIEFARIPVPKQTGEFTWTRGQLRVTFGVSVWFVPGPGYVARGQDDPYDVARTVSIVSIRC